MQKRVPGLIKNKGLLLLLLTGAVYFFLKYLCPLVIPVLIAGIFLTLCYPAFDDFQKKTRIKKQYMAGTILFLICAVLIVLVWFGGYALIEKLPSIIKSGDRLLVEVKDNLTGMVREFGNRFELDVTELEEGIEEQFTYFFTHFEERILPVLIGNTWVYVGWIGKTVGMLAVTMIATILLAKDYDSILALVGAGEGSRVCLEIFLKVIRHIAAFLKAQFMILFTISLVCVCGLSLAGIKNGWILGIAAGILDALPFIGTGIVLVPLAVWNFIQGAYLKAIICLILYGICALIREFMEPKLVGKGVGIYPVAVLAAIYAGIKLFGVAGIIKGPFGLILLTQTFSTISRYIDNKSRDEL